MVFSKYADGMSGSEDEWPLRTTCSRLVCGLVVARADVIVPSGRRYCAGVRFRIVSAVRGWKPVEPTVARVSPGNARAAAAEERTGEVWMGFAGLGFSGTAVSEGKRQSPDL